MAYLWRKGEGQGHGEVTKPQHALVSKFRHQLRKQIQRYERGNNASVVDDWVWGEQGVVQGRVISLNRERRIEHSNEKQAQRVSQASNSAEEDKGCDGRVGEIAPAACTATQLVRLFKMRWLTDKLTLCAHED
jgi:hypothetical protein